MLRVCVHTQWAGFHDGVQRWGKGGTTPVGKLERAGVSCEKCFRVACLSQEEYLEEGGIQGYEVRE